MVLTNLCVVLVDNRGFKVFWRKQFALPFFPRPDDRLEIEGGSTYFVELSVFDVVTGVAYVQVVPMPTGGVPWEQLLLEMNDARWELFATEGACDPGLKEIIAKYKEVPDAPQS